MRRWLERTAWLRRIGAVWKALEFIDTLRGYWELIPGLMRAMFGIALFSLVPGWPAALVLATLDVMSDNWPVVLIVALGIGFGLWGLITLGLHRRHIKKEPFAVPYAGIRWVHAGWSNPDDPDDPGLIARPECPRHKVELLFRQVGDGGELGAPRRIQGWELVRTPVLGTLWCPHGKGHSFDVQASVPQGTAFDKLREVAVELLWNEL